MVSLRGSNATATPSWPAGATTRQQISLTLSLLGREVLAFHPRLVKLTGSVSSALMLSQSLYWSRILIERHECIERGVRGERDGWFWKTRADWRQEISLSRHEQDTARKRLRTLPFWQESCSGLPAKMHFRIDLDQLAKEIDHDFQGHWDWQNRQQKFQLLGQPVLIFRQLADLCQSVTAAILLSHFLGIERCGLRTGQRQTGWQRYQFDQMMRVTGLTRDELIHARKILREQGYLIERRVGVPPRSEWRLSFPMLIQNLGSIKSSELFESDPVSSSTVSHVMADVGTDRPHLETRVVDLGARNQQSSLLETRKLGNPDFQAISDALNIRGGFCQNRFETRMVVQFSGIRPTGKWESSQLEIGKPTHWMAGIPNNSCPDSRFLYKGLTTGKPITTTTSPPTSSTAGGEIEPAVGGGGHLTVQAPTPNRKLPEAIAWPNLLLTEERPIAIHLLEDVGAVAQQILDELAGQNALKPIQQPLAYLRKLAAQARAGIFVPSVAIRVAEQRRHQQARLDARQKNTSPPNPAALTAEQRDAARQKLEAMRAALCRKKSVSFSAGHSSIPTRH